MTATTEYEALRPRLLAIAYRMLGSAAEAEDAVQDAWLRWQTTDHDAVRDPGAWLATTLGRLCIDRLTSARARRETYPGPWLPEPVVTTEPIDTESISLGFLVLLERLSPVERAVFLLHKVFDHSHGEIARALGISDAAARQACHRAQVRIDAERPRFVASRADHERLLRAFASALTTGDIHGMTALLAEDAVLAADSGGKVRGAARKPVCGGGTVARFLAGVFAKQPLPAEFSFEVRDVNGWPALVGRMPDGVVFVIAIETDGRRITAVRNIVNPDKLALRPSD